MAETDVLCTKALWRYQGHLGFRKWHSTFSVADVEKTETNSVTHYIAQGHSRSQKEHNKNPGIFFVFSSRVEIYN
jgi:hypothetical protein